MSLCFNAPQRVTYFYLLFWWLWTRLYSFIFIALQRRHGRALNNKRTLLMAHWVHCGYMTWMLISWVELRWRGNSSSIWRYKNGDSGLSLAKNKNLYYFNCVFTDVFSCWRVGCEDARWAAYRRCHEKTSYVSNYAFITLLHEWVNRGQMLQLEKLLCVWFWFHR